MNLKRYQQILLSNYPSTQKIINKTNLAPLLFDQVLSIPKSTFNQIKTVIIALQKLKTRSHYLKHIKSHPLLKAPTPENSILTSYDFHIDKDKVPRLIEVNTNASGYLIGSTLAQYHRLDYKTPLKKLKNAFIQEFYAFNKKSKSSVNKSIQRDSSAVNQAPFIKYPFVITGGLIDENPFTQKMLIEFLMYIDFFKTFNWNFSIYEASKLQLNSHNKLIGKQGKALDFIYNRLTDFYLQNHPYLAKAYQKNTLCFSPTPMEYHLLSHKQRLILWYQYKDEWKELKDIKHNLIFTNLITKENKSFVFKNKKKYFFKPTQGHGGKKVYKGKNLTNKKFNMLCSENSLYQEEIPPSLFKHPNGKEYKYDVRAYCYATRIDLILARCYTGQLTNFKAEDGGFASCIIS